MISFLGFLVSISAAITLGTPDVFFRNYSVVTEKFWWWWACVPGWLFFIGPYLDAIDGSVARKSGKTSKFGGFFDSTLDRLSDSVIFLGLMYAGFVWPFDTDNRIDSLLCFIALSMVLLISYTRSRAEAEGVIMKGVGFMERAERVFIMLGGYSVEWMIYGFETQYKGGQTTLWFFPTFFIFFIVLCAHTVFQRIRWTYKWLNGKIDEETKKKLLEEITNPQTKEDTESEEENPLEDEKK